MCANIKTSLGIMIAVVVILVTKMVLTNSANDVKLMTTGAEMGGIMKSMAGNILDPSRGK